MVIDFHTHTFPDNICSDAMKKLVEMSGFTPYLDGSEKALSDDLKKGPVTHAVVWPIATKPENVVSINRYSVTRKYNDLIFGGAMHPSFADFDKEFLFLKENNIHGIKLHPEFQDFKPNSRELFPLYESAIKNDIFIIFHTGKEEFLKRKPPNGHPLYFSELNKLYPALKIVLAHFGAHGYIKEVEEYLMGKDIYIDLSYEFPFIPKDFISKMLNSHSKELLLYGSDSPWQPVQEYYSYFEGIRLPQETKEMISSINAKKLLGLA